MDKSISQIVFDCNLNLFAELICDRCTSEFERKVENNFQLVYLFGKESVDDEEINIHIIPPETDKINLTEDVLEYAKLSLPLKILCNENCKGLCPQCGANFNKEKCDCKNDSIDPIWEPLQQLKKSSNN